MFDNTINNEIDKIFEELPIIIDSISFKRINTLRIDDFYKNFCKQELLWRIYGNFTELKNHKNFSFDINNFEAFFYDYSTALLNNSVINTDEFNELITLSAKYRLHFLCKPIETLINFVYVDCYSKPIVDVFIKTGFFPEYSFIQEAYSDFLKTNNLYNYSHELVFKNDFEKHIQEYISEYFTNVTTDKLQNVFVPLFKFFSLNENDLSAPALALAMILNDIGFNESSQYLSNNFEADERLTNIQFCELINESMTRDDFSEINDDEPEEKIQNEFEPVFEYKSTFKYEPEPEQNLDINDIEFELETNLKTDDIESEPFIDFVDELSIDDELLNSILEDKAIASIFEEEFNTNNDVEEKEIKKVPENLKDEKANDFEDKKNNLNKKLKLTKVFEENVRIINIEEITEKVYDDGSKIIPQSIDFDLKYSIRKAVNDIYKNMK
jgi:hypothetical protein